MPEPSVRDLFLDNVVDSCSPRGALCVPCSALSVGRTAKAARKHINSSTRSLLSCLSTQNRKEGTTKVSSHRRTHHSVTSMPHTNI